MGPRTFGTFNHSVFNISPDPELIIWSLKWWPFSFAHHLNPFYTTYIWNPKGFSMAWATSVPTLAIILAPLTLLANPQLSFNLIAITALPLAALTCYWLIYYLTHHYFASLLGGCLFGFSTYQFAQLLGHPSLYCTCLVPLVILLFLLRLDSTLSKKLFIIFEAICIVLQFGVSNEVLTTFLVFAFIALVLFYLLSTKSQKKLLKTTTVELIFAGCFAVIILSPYLYYIIVDYRDVPKIINSPDVFSANLLNYIIPTPITRILGNHFHSISAGFSANYSEDGAYLGAPFLVLLAYYVITYWKKAYVKALGVLLAILIVASLGYRLNISGKQTSIILPWAIVHIIPVLRSALPDRITLFISLVAAIMTGLWLSYQTSRFIIYLKFTIVIFIIVTLLPNPVYSWQDLKVPRIFQAKYVAQYIPAKSNVLLLPFGYTGNDMYYQVTSSMWFTQSGGYMGFTPPSESTLPIVTAAFYADSPEPTFTTDIELYCKINKISQIIYTPNTGPNLKKVLTELQWPTAQEDGALVIQVPVQYRT